jgi:hypothetical protein
MENLKDNEKELVKLVNFFSRQSKKLMNEGKLSPEHEQVAIACENLIKQMNANAAIRSEVLQRREELKAIVKDEPVCSQCNSNANLKYISVVVNEKGWKCNKYKCRRCNIEFIWNRPNNPWDMLSFMRELVKLFEDSIQEETNEELKKNSELMLVQTQENLAKLESIIHACDKEYEEMKVREEEMDAMIKDFRRHLLIAKAKMEAEED